MSAAQPSRCEASASSSGGSDVRPAAEAAGVVAVIDRESGGRRRCRAWASVAATLAPGIRNGPGRPGAPCKRTRSGGRNGVSAPSVRYASPAEECSMRAAPARCSSSIAAVGHRRSWPLRADGRPPARAVERGSHPLGHRSGDAEDSREGAVRRRPARGRRLSRRTHGLYLQLRSRARRVQYADDRRHRELQAARHRGSRVVCAARTA